MRRRKKKRRKRRRRRKEEEEEEKDEEENEDICFKRMYTLLASFSLFCFVLFLLFFCCDSADRSACSSPRCDRMSADG